MICGIWLVQNHACIRLNECRSQPPPPSNSTFLPGDLLCPHDLSPPFYLWLFFPDSFTELCLRLSVPKLSNSRHPCGTHHSIPPSLPLSPTFPESISQGHQPFLQLMRLHDRKWVLTTSPPSQTPHPVTSGIQSILLLTSPFYCHHCSL